jgi:hypothetical protein
MQSNSENASLGIQDGTESPWLDRSIRFGFFIIVFIAGDDLEECHEEEQCPHWKTKNRHSEK